MHITRFLSFRLLKNDHNHLSKPVIRISLWCVGLSITVMLVALAVLFGFKREISDKMTGFAGHVHVESYQTGHSLESLSIRFSTETQQKIEQTSEVTFCQPYAIKPGLMKSEDINLGFAIKGVNTHYYKDFFAKNLIAGKLPEFKDSIASDEILISKFIAKKMNLTVGDKARCYFISNNETRARAFVVCGIYESGLPFFDEQICLGDIRQIQRINNWEADWINGYEVFTSNFSHLNEITQQINSILPYELIAQSVAERYPEIYGWLDLTNMNVFVILIILSIVVAISIIGLFVVTIIERTNFIGILKTLGCSNTDIRKIFVLHVWIIAFVGIVLGNILALSLCKLQQIYGIIKLDKASYFLSEVPIHLDGWSILAVNASILVICLFAMLIPAAAISRISPAQSVKFD